MTRTWMLVCAAALVVVGCDKKEDAAPKPAETTKAQAAADLPRPPVGIAPPAEETAEDDLATPEEFEDEAEQEIVAATVESEIDKLEKEIGE